MFGGDEEILPDYVKSEPFEIDSRSLADAIIGHLNQGREVDFVFVSLPRAMKVLNLVRNTFNKLLSVQIVNDTTLSINRIVETEGSLSAFPTRYFEG